MTKWIRANWGLALFLLITLPCFIKVGRSWSGGHFQIFTEGARQLWSGSNPYEEVWESGKWIYSPPTGYFFYSIFAYLPPRFGVVLYMLLSYLLFIAGGISLVRELRLSPHSKSLFWLLIANEMIGALLNLRLEVWIVGSTLLSAAILLRHSSTFLSALLLAVPTILKAQTLAVAGLLGVYFLRARRRSAWILAFVFSSAMLLISPVFFRGLRITLADYSAWNSALGPHLEGTYRDFQHVYRFLAQAFHIDLCLQQVQLIGGLCALAFAVIVFISARYNTAKISTLLCFALGAVFATSLSPMSQSAGYILYAPLLAIALKDVYRNYWIIGIAWILISGLSSDFVPKDVKLDLLPYALKSLGPLLLGGWIVRQNFLKRL